MFVRPSIRGCPGQDEAQVLAVVAQPVGRAHCIPQGERQVAQRPRALLDPSVRALDGDVRHRLRRIERDLRNTGA